MKEFVSEMSSTESASAASLKESSDSVSKISSVVCTCVLPGYLHEKKRHIVLMILYSIEFDGSHKT